MSATTEPILLPGLDALDPLGFLASLGCVLAATEHCERAGLDAPTLRFELGPSPRPIVDGPFRDVDALVDVLYEDLCRCAGRVDGEARDAFLAFSYEVKGKPVHDLKPPPEEFRAVMIELLAQPQPPRRALDWFAATLTDVAIDNGGNGKPFALHFTAGQQRFLTIAQELLDGADAKANPKSRRRRVGADDLRAAVVGPWPDDRELKVFSWSPKQDRPYALRANDPSSDQKLGTPGADWLALRGVGLLSSAPVGDRIGTSGVHGRWKSASFSYPIWSTALDSDAVRSLLRHPAVADPVDRPKSALATLPRGVEVLTCRISRSDQGGYGAFSRPIRR